MAAPRSSRIVTCEAMTPGHPDKLCDQVSDCVLDAIFAQDPDAKVACETFTTTGLVLVGGEIKTSAYVELQEREFAMEDDGYTATRHQREVGAGYFDLISTIASAGTSSTLALKGSTEEEQFH